MGSWMKALKVRYWFYSRNLQNVIYGEVSTDRGEYQKTQTPLTDPGTSGRHLSWENLSFLIKTMGANNIYPTSQGCFKNQHERMLVIYYDRVRNVHILGLEKLRQIFLATNSLRGWVQNPQLLISTLDFYSLDQKCLTQKTHKYLHF